MARFLKKKKDANGHFDCAPPALQHFDGVAVPEWYLLGAYSTSYKNGRYADYVMCRLSLCKMEARRFHCGTLPSSVPI